MLARVREVNRRPPPEESLAVRAAVLVAVVTAAVAVIEQDVGGPLLRLAVLGGIPAGFVFSHVARYRDGFWLKVGLALGLLIVFVDFLGSLSGIGPGTVAQVQIPLAELFLWVQLLHSIDVPARRDLMFSLVSSLVLMAVAGVLSISLSYGLFLAVWGVAALASLVLAHRSELSEVPVLGDARRAFDRRRLVTSVAGVTALVVLVGSAAFAVLPAAGSARNLTFPSELPEVVPTGGLPGALSNPTLGDDDPSLSQRGESRSGSGRASFGYFGFSTSLDTSLRGRPDETLVMRVRASAPDFWRGQTFDVWDGRSWTVGEDRPTPIRGASPIDVPIGREDVEVQRGREFVQTYYLEQAQPNLIFGAYAPTQLYFPDNTVFQLPDGTLRAGVGLGEGAVYTVVSRRPPATPERLRAAGGPQDVPSSLPPQLLERYLQLPENVPHRVAGLARSVTATAQTTYDKTQALIAWIAGNTTYTLDIPPLPRGADAVEQFLFVDRQGFCEQIATSLVVMLRSLGVPARLGVGYAAGERNPFTGLFEVRASDAHAWAEVYFPGFGWQVFDPTAAVPLAGDGGARRASFGVSSFLAARLPSPPAWVGEAGVSFVVVVVLAVAAARARLGLQRRRARSRRTWAEAWQDQLDGLGAARGRPRRPDESVREYVDVLRYGLLPHERWADAVAVVERSAYAGIEVSADVRAMADRVLEEAAARGR